MYFQNEYLELLGQQAKLSIALLDNDPFSSYHFVSPKSHIWECLFGGIV